MIRACMIDGFGWFRGGDYRRAWLLFDEVEYLLPREVVGPLWYPPAVFASPEYQVHRLGLETGDDELAEAVARDLADPELVRLLARVPSRDASYAQRVVETDRELAPLRARFSEPAAAISILATRLLLRAAESGAMPIVGKQYAWDILARKLKLDQTAPTAGFGLAPAMPRQQLLVALLGVGLSLSFLDDAALIDIPFAKLEGFKQRSARLLRAHRLHLVEVAQQFQELPDGATLSARLAALRLEAQKKQAELDSEAHEAWLATGLGLLNKAVVAATASVLPLVVLVRGSSLGQLLLAAAPGVGLAAAAGLATLDKARQARRTPFAFLFEAEKLLEQ